MDVFHLNYPPPPLFFLKLDVQIPSSAIPLLVSFNDTFLDDDNRYLIIVNPLAWFRLPDSNNKIDARIIDSRTGIFLDMTALWSVYWNPGALQCKTPWKISYQSINPLERTKFNGVPTWVPSRPRDVLELEYGTSALVKPLYRTFMFNNGGKQAGDHDQGWARMDCTAIYEYYMDRIGFYILNERIMIDWESSGIDGDSCRLTMRYPPTQAQLDAYDGYDEEGDGLPEGEIVTFSGVWKQGRTRYY